MDTALLPLDAWKQAAEDLRDGRYAALGHEWPRLRPGDPSTWHLCPASGRHWPDQTFCFAVPYRRAQGYGDVKLVWEINRLQHLQSAAAHAACSGDEAVARLCRRQLLDWIAANPSFRGVNWASGIELALRVVSILVVLSLLGTDGFDAGERAALRKALAAHGWWLDRFPSRFSSANNHLVAEAGALYLLGLLAPDLPGARHWRSYGRTTLVREVHNQILADGVGAEQSPTYTAFSLEWWMLAAVVGGALGEPFPTSALERVERAAECLAWMLDGADGHPRIGDDDEGRVLAASTRTDAYVPAIVEGLSSFVRRGDLRPAGDYPQLWRALLPPLQERKPRATGLRTFPAGGYTVVRSGDERPLLLVFDHGPLGYLSIAAHGHADALSLWLHRDGRPILVDAGTFLYHAGGAWRDHFRSTRAHNTLAVDGADSSRIAGAFNWASKATARLLEASTENGCWSIAAEHDGYVRRYGVVHRRTVRSKADGTLVVEDRLLGGAGQHDVEIGFLLHPTCETQVAPDGLVTVTVGDRSVLAIEHEGPLTCRVERGAENPPGGWYSRAFGQREPTERVVFAGKLGMGDLSLVRLALPDG